MLPDSVRGRIESVKRPPRAARARGAVLTLAIAIAALASASESTSPATGTVLNLESAVALALERNRALISDRLGREMGRADLAIAESERGVKWTVSPYAGAADRSGQSPQPEVGTRSRWRLPLDSGGELSLDWRVASGLGRADGERYSSTADLVLRQPLLRGRGKETATLGLRRARLRDEVGRISLRRAKSATVRLALSRYRTYARNRLELAASEESLDRSMELLALNRILVESGRMAVRDVVQAESGIARQRLSLVSARYAAEQSRSALLELLDLRGDESVRIDTALDLEGFEPTEETREVDDMVHDALRARPAHMIAAYSVEEARLAYHGATDATRWNLDLVLETGIEGSSASLAAALQGTGGTSYSAGVELEIPLSPGSRTPAGASQSRAGIALERARNELYLVRERIRLELDNALRTLDLTYHRVELARVARRLVEEKTRIEREKLQSGLSSNFQLLSFEDERLGARRAEIGAVFAYMEAVTELEAVRGTLLERWAPRETNP